MGRINEVALQLVVMVSLLALGGTVAAQDIPAEYQQVLDLLGKKGDFKANVFKLNIPRSDLKVTIDGTPTPTPFGFGGWLAMTKGDKGNDVMMGDLVLLEDEVNTVMSALLENGLEVTALHNHFFWEQPRIFYMHVHGLGKPADLARKVKPAVDLIGHVVNKFALSENTGIKTVSVNTGQLEQRVVAGQLDTAALNRVVGHTGEQLAAGVFKFTIGRDDVKLKEMGAVINARMGFNSWAALYGSDDSALIAGDVAMLDTEVTPVLRALRTHGLKVVSIHHHMTGTKPTIIFLHYFGKGRASSLAEGFRLALDQLGAAKRTMRH